MKNFIINVTLFWLAFFLMIGAIRISWYQLYPHTLNKNFINKDIHSIVIGPSNGTFAWDDNIISNTKNLCAIGSSFGSCYQTLRWVTEYNDVKADTVILCASFSSFAYYQDSIKTYLLRTEREDIRNILNYSTFYDHYKNKIEYWTYFFTSFPYVSLKGVKPGFDRLDRNKLNDPKLYNAINEIKRNAGGTYESVTENYLRNNCTYQIDNLRQIKKYCDDHDYVLVVLSTPVFKIPDIVSDKGYYQLLCKELGDSTLVADYSRFEFPDSTYYADLEHVNHRGAKYFSEKIAREGLKFKYAIDLSKQKYIEKYE